MQGVVQGVPDAALCSQVHYVFWLYAIHQRAKCFGLSHVDGLKGGAHVFQPFKTILLQGWIVTGVQVIYTYYLLALFNQPLDYVSANKAGSSFTSTVIGDQQSKQQIPVSGLLVRTLVRSQEGGKGKATHDLGRSWSPQLL